MNSKYRNIFLIFGIVAIVVMLCTFDMEYDELLANLRRAGIWLPAVIGLWVIIYLFNTLSWYIIIRDGKKGTPIPFWKVYKLTVSGFALNYATPVGLMGGEPYRIMELTPYVGASKATSSVILYVMMHIFSHFCFWLFSIFLYLALRPVDFAMGMVLFIIKYVSITILPATTVRKVGTILTFSDGWVILCRLRLTSFAVIQSLLHLCVWTWYC